MAERQDSVDAYAREGAAFREPVPVPRWATIVAAVVVVLALGTPIGLTVRESNRRADATRCAANLKQIGQAILLYSVANGNQYPDSFATLMRERPRYRDGTSFDLSMFTCPAGDDAPPADEVRADVGGYRLTADSMPSRIAYLRSGGYSHLIVEECVAIEVPGRHGDGVHVMHPDGSVELRTVSKTRSATWADVQDDVKRNRPIRWPASQPWR